MREQLDTRNTNQHRQTAAENNSIRHGRLLKSIQEQYAQAPEMLAANHTILDKPIKDQV
jgi:hypothetical protein